MWVLWVLGITVLLSRAVLASLVDDSNYYLTETSDDRSGDRIEKSRYEKSELKTSEQTNFNESDEDQTEYQEIEDTIGNRGAKRSITNTDVRDMPTGQRQVPAPLATLLYWPESENDQVIGMEQRRNPSMQERRNPAFSPWGGKRDVRQRYQTITKIRRPVRVPFNSWGGKRNGESVHQRDFADVKRVKFFNFGSKKRAYSNAWAAKNATARIIDDLYPSSNYRYHSRHRKSSIVDIGQRMSNDLGSAEDEHYEGPGSDNKTGDKRGSLKLITTGEMTTLGSTMGGRSFPRVQFEPWGGKKRRFFGCNNDGSHSPSLSLILCKIEQMFPSNG